jgi:hypothetical protein
MIDLDYLQITDDDDATADLASVAVAGCFVGCDHLVTGLAVAGGEELVGFLVSAAILVDHRCCLADAQ